MTQDIDLPTTEFSQPFWEQARDGLFTVQRCDECGQWTFPPRVCCPSCWSDGLRWTTPSGRATVYSFTTVHRPPSVDFAAEVPYVVGLVDLEEGPRMMCRITGCSPDDVRIGMTVRVSFTDHPVFPLLRVTPI